MEAAPCFPAVPPFNTAQRENTVNRTAPLPMGSRKRKIQFNICAHNARLHPRGHVEFLTLALCRTSPSLHSLELFLRTLSFRRSVAAEYPAHAVDIFVLKHHVCLQQSKSCTRNKQEVRQVADGGRVRKRYARGVSGLLPR